MTISTQRESLVDQKFDTDISKENYINKLFVRVVAKEKRFEKIDFKYTIFDTCYFRKCTFDSCDFTGCQFLKTNLVGSTFCGCKFDYATFEKTSVDVEILDSEFPPHENLKQRFARTLRTNYQSLGDSESANKAMTLELEATKVHLWKAWKSRESYYRKKYQGAKRITALFRWLKFKMLDYIWGNGESEVRLIVSIFVILILLTLIHVLFFEDIVHVKDCLKSFSYMISTFFGISRPEGYPDFYLTIILFIRLVALGFFMSIIIKRYNRR